MVAVNVEKKNLGFRFDSGSFEEALATTSRHSSESNLTDMMVV